MKLPALFPVAFFAGGILLSARLLGLPAFSPRICLLTIVMSLLFGWVALRRNRIWSATFFAAYLPSVSTFRFASSFICLTVSSRGAVPVVCVVVAGGALLGTDVCSEGVLAGRVAVAAGLSLWALAVCIPKRKALASTDAASAAERVCW